MSDREMRKIMLDRLKTYHTDILFTYKMVFNENENENNQIFYGVDLSCVFVKSRSRLAALITLYDYLNENCEDDNGNKIDLYYTNDQLEYYRKNKTDIEIVDSLMDDMFNVCDGKLYIAPYEIPTFTILKAIKIE